MRNTISGNKWSLLELTPNSVKKLMIQRNSKVVDTRPERAMKEILEEMKIPYEHDVSDKFYDYDVKDLFTFQIDFIINHEAALFVNGEYHNTPIIRKKDEWKSKLIAEHGIKVINFDAELLRLKKHRPLAISALKVALGSKERILWCDA